MKPGDRVGDAYVIERFLAGGGMGEIYLARDTRLERRVAVKVMRSSLAVDDESDSRFEREARTLSRVVHPNIVGIHAIGRHDEDLFIVMEYVDGPNLGDVLHERGALALDEVMSITRQVAAGLAEAHALGLVHRDIKPGNILLRDLASGARLAKLVDFGLARDYGEGSSITQGPSMLGTPAYMSPEQIRGDALDGRSDLYSLAVVVWQMLVGRMPFRKDSIPGLLVAHMTEPPPPLPKELGVAGQAELDRELVRALAKDPADRHTGVAEFAAALERAAGLHGPRATASSACPCCGEATGTGLEFCGRCGVALAPTLCPACGVEREAGCYACVECGALLLPSVRPSAARRTAGDTSGLRAWTAAVLVARQETATASLADFAERFATVVEREGGRPLAVLGHEAVAVFGLGGMREREVESAVDAALGLQGSAASGSADPEAGPTVSVGVEVGAVTARGGLNAWGLALLGGGALDEARAALESAEPGDVTLGPAAALEVGGAFHWRAATNERRHKILRRRDVARSLREDGRLSFDMPCVGREAEVGHLLRALQAVTDDRALAAVPLVGVPGVGKSRVLGEFLRRLEDGTEGVTVDVGHCSQAGLGLAWEPFSRILRHRLRLHEGMRAEGVAERLGELIGASADGQDRVRRDALIRLLGLGQGHDDTIRPATDLDKEAAFGAWKAYLTQATGRGPLVLVFEDMQWARDPTLDLLAWTLREAAELPILVVVAFRPDRAANLLERIRPPVMRTMPLQVRPLAPEDEQALVRAASGGRDVPERVIEAVRRFANGVPVLIVEAMHALLDELRAPNAGLGADVTQLHLDRSLGELVVRRAGRLGPPERALLEAAAVAGLSSPRGMLAAICEGALSEHSVDRLKQAGFLVEARTSRFRDERELSFREPMVREILAASLDAARARELHRRAAAWLLGWKGPRPPGLGALVAAHFEAGGDMPMASRYLLTAARDLLGALSNSDAFDAFGASAEAAREWRAADPEDRDARAVFAQAAIGRAEVGLRMGAFEAVREALDEAMAVAGPEHPEPMARALCLLGDLEAELYHPDAALEAYTKARNFGARLDVEHGLEVFAAGRLAIALLKVGRAEDAERTACEAIDDAGDRPVDSDLAHGLGSAYSTLGRIAMMQGRHAEALAHLAVSREHRARIGDAVGAAMSLLSMGNVAYAGGDLEGAARHSAAAAEECRRIGYVQGEAFARNNLGHALLKSGRVEEAIVELSAAEGTLKRLDLPQVAETLGHLSRAHSQLGNHGAAIMAASQALDVARSAASDALQREARAALEAAEQAHRAEVGEDDGDTLPTMDLSKSFK